MLTAKKTIYLDAGHSTTDPGTITQFGNETDFNRKIRDALVPQLERCGFKVEQVPDELNLRESINWVNERAKIIIDGLALAIHCNCCDRKGAESYYYTDFNSSKKIAQILIDEYCKETGFNNIGARSDSVTRFGALSFIRDTNCWATLIECCFLDNEEDVNRLKVDFKKVARGICKGVCTIYEMSYIEEVNPSVVDREEIKKQIIKLLEKL